MKNLILSFCCVILIQISTCANQKSISSYGSRDNQTSLINQLFSDYAEEHENVESLYKSFLELNNAKNKTYAKWKNYDLLAERYYDEVKSYINHFDTATQQILLDYFNKEEINYQKSVAKFNVASDLTNKELATLDDRIHMMKLLASTEQLAVVLKNDLPEIQQLTTYNDKLSKLSKKVEATNTTIADKSKLVITQK